MLTGVPLDTAQSGAQGSVLHRPLACSLPPSPLRARRRTAACRTAGGAPAPIARFT